MKIKKLTFIGLMTAVLCVTGPFALPIPFSPVPISLITLSLFLILYCIGTTGTFLCYFLYLLAGLVGLPVFTGFSGGIGKLLGPTGGYLIGLLLLIPIAGFFIHKKNIRAGFVFMGMLAGMAGCYLVGTAWLAWQMRIPFKNALVIGVFPFVIGDLLKLVIALLLGPQIRNRLKRAGIYER